MKNIFSKLFFAAAMMTLSVAVFADTAVLSWYMGADGAAVATSANSITGATGCAAEGFTIAITGNTGKNWSAGNGDISYNGTTYKTLKNSNGAQNTITLPEGKYASEVEFYVVSNADASGVLSEFNGTSCSNTVSSLKDYNNPTLISKTLSTPVNSFTFTFSTKQVCFIAVVTYSGSETPTCAEPTIAFGSWNTTEHGFPVTITNNEAGATLTYAIGEGEFQAYTAPFFVGSEVEVSAKASKADYDDAIVSETAPVHVEGDAEATFAWLVGNETSATITTDKSDCVTSTQVAVGAGLTTGTKNNYDANNGNTMVTYIPGTSNAGNVAEVRIEYSIAMAKGTTFQLSGVSYDAIKDGTDNASYSWSYTVDGVESTITTVDKDYLLRNNNTSGTPALRHEETITADAGKNVTVRFYVSGFGNTKKFALSNIVIVGIISGEPEADDPETPVEESNVFGITRAVANATSAASEGDVTAYKLSEDALVEASVEGVTITMNYGSQDALTNSVRTFTWYNGTEPITCYAEKGEKSYSNRLNDGETVSPVTALNENCYYGFDLVVEPGKRLSISSINADVMKNGEHAHYQIKVYRNGTLIKTLAEMVANNKANSDMRQSLNTESDEALQDLTGTVTLKMFFWDEAENKYIEIKDFNVSVVVENNPGEGINTLSFVSFESAAHPEFTNGEVTATWSNKSNNVGPDEKNRGIRMQGGYEYEMKLEVPVDSYISSVVFVWNKNGNNSSGTKPFIDLSITNNVGAEVSSLYYDGGKVNETEWTCGEVRESELIFAQGEGDFYVNSIRVTYLKQEGEVSKSYTRTHSHMNLNTLCFPYTVTAYTGATFYTMLYKRVEGSTPIEVVLEEHEGNLVAGNPYFYIPEGSQLELTYTGARDDSPNTVNGVVGSYDANTAVPSGSYVTYNGEIRAVGSNVKLAEYRAYINMSAVSEQEVAPAPGRRVLRVGNADAPAVATEIEAISNQQSAISQKVLRDGQLLIIRDGKIYNAQGQLVK